jgi:recombination protein RecT
MTEQNTAVAVQPKPEHPLVTLRSRLEARSNEIKAAWPGVSPDRIIRAIITSAQINPDLLACNFQSLFLACMRACRDGLIPDGVEGAIVPYKEKATWIPMYKGLLKKFQTSGQFRHVMANCVFEGDEFAHYIDEHGEHLRHTPSDTYDDSKIVRVYAMATTKDGGVFITVLPRKEIDKVRKWSRATRDDAPWNVWYSEMAKKTALRRISKMLPNAPQFEDDEEAYDDESADRLQLVNPDRARGAAAALDAFAPAGDTGEDMTSRSPEGAGHHPDSGQLDATGETGGRGDTGNDKAATQPILEPQTATADAQAAAFRRGEDAKAKGHQRKALPPEYRTPERDAEAQEWLRGWDSKPEGSPKA